MTIIYILFTFITVASGWLCYYVYNYVCIVSLCVFTCISTCALGIPEDIFKLIYPRLIKSLVIFTTRLQSKEL